MNVQLATCVFVMVVGLVSGRITGPPIEESANLCTSMTPQHGDNIPTAGDPPFMIVVSSSTFTKNNSITVTIEGLDNSTIFQGLFVQARVYDDNFLTNSAIGTFSSFSSDTGGLNCSNSANSAWGHTNNNEKASASAEWTYSAGCDDIGRVAFRATVVEEFATYYVDIRSEDLRFDRSNCKDNDAGMINSSMIMIVASIICYMVLLI